MAHMGSGSPAVVCRGGANPVTEPRHNTRPLSYWSRYVTFPFIIVSFTLVVLISLGAIL